ncbi:hypothetical protein FOCC_FOCC006273, partial [Frankliniella occidentalis]
MLQLLSFPDQSTDILGFNFRSSKKVVQYSSHQKRLEMSDRKMTKDEGGMGRRPHVLLTKNDHDNEKPPTIILRTREGENRAVSPSQTRTPTVLKKESTDTSSQPSYQLAYKNSAPQ